MLVSFIQIKISDVGIVNHEKPIVNLFYIQVNNRSIATLPYNPYGLNNICETHSLRVLPLRNC